MWEIDPAMYGIEYVINVTAQISKENMGEAVNGMGPTGWPSGEKLSHLHTPCHILG